MSDLKLMILCGPGPRHVYVANRLARAGEAVAIVQETGSRITWKKILRVLSDPAAFLRNRRRKAGPGGADREAEAEYFFQGEKPAFEREELVTRVSHINHIDVLALAKTHEPDLILVFGVSLIQGELLQLGRLGMINLHGGVSPYYRGADGVFWALYHGELDKVGCTIHYIDAGIDTGRLVAHVFPEVREGDGELDLFRRAVKDGAETMAEMVKRMADGDRFGRSQYAKGRLFLVKDRLEEHERTLQINLEAGLLKGVALPARRRWYRTGGQVEEE